MNSHTALSVTSTAVDYASSAGARLTAAEGSRSPFPDPSLPTRLPAAVKTFVTPTARTGLVSIFISLPLRVRKHVAGTSAVLARVTHAAFERFHQIAFSKKETYLKALGHRIHKGISCSMETLFQAIKCIFYSQSKITVEIEKTRRPFSPSPTVRLSIDVLRKGRRPGCIPM